MQQVECKNAAECGCVEKTEDENFNSKAGKKFFLLLIIFSVK